MKTSISNIRSVFDRLKIQRFAFFPAPITKVLVAFRTSDPVPPARVIVAAAVDVPLSIFRHRLSPALGRNVVNDVDAGRVAVIALTIGVIVIVLCPKSDAVNTVLPDVVVARLPPVVTVLDASIAPFRRKVPSSASGPGVIPTEVKQVVVLQSTALTLVVKLSLLKMNPATKATRIPITYNDRFIGYF